MQNKQSSVSGFVHLLTPAAAQQVKASKIAQSLTCLDQAALEALESKWDWSKLSESNEVVWSVELIEQFKDRWNWNGYDGLSANICLPWSVELIERYKDRWYWARLSGNNGLPWSVELIERYKDRWYWSGLSGNSNLPWSVELIERYKNCWDWERLSGNSDLPWSVEMIDHYKKLWDWNELSGCAPLSAELIEHFKSRLNWRELSSNNRLPWSVELIEQYKDRWKWSSLSGNSGLPWSADLIKQYEERWSWKNLSWDESGLPLSAELIEQFKDRWNWKGYYGLSANSGLPWSAELIERFKDLWNWKGYYGLSANSGLPWSAELIEQFKDCWYWGALSCNDWLPWSVELIEQFKDRWDWKLLSKSKLPWSVEMLERFKDHWDWEVLAKNRSLPRSAAFKTYITKYCDSATNNADQHKDVRFGSLSDQFIIRFPFTKSYEDGASRPNMAGFSDDELSDPRACLSLILSWYPEEMGSQDEDEQSKVKIVRIEVLYDGVTPIDGDSAEIGYWFKDGQLYGYPAPIVLFTLNRKVSANKFIAAINSSGFQIFTAAIREKNGEPYMAEDHNGYVSRLGKPDWIRWQSKLQRKKAFCGKVFEFPDGLPSYGHAFAGTDFILERQSWIKH